MNQRLDWDDLPHTEGQCEQCGAQNSCVDAECQYCDGVGEIADQCTCKTDDNRDGSE